MATCRSCGDGAAPVFCGVLSPPGVASPLTITLCGGAEAPADVLRAACSSEPTCGPHLLPALARQLLAVHIIPRGRAALRAIAQWMPAANNLYEGKTPVAGNINYGVQRQTEPLLNTPIDTVTTYSDLLAWLLLSCAPHLGGPRYLEIGVSVGKNLHQLTEHASKHFMTATAAAGGATATLVGFDLEELNPNLLPLHPQLGELVASWPSPPEVALEAQTPPSDSTHRPSTRSLKLDQRSTLARHRCDISHHEGESCALYYLSADLKTDPPWEALASRLPGTAERRGFDLIFSDAWHSPAAVQWEARQLVQRGLLNFRSVIVWDDLNTPGMQQAFGSLCLALRQHHPAAQESNTTKSEDAGRAAGEEGTRAVIDCFLSAVAPGWVASNGRSNLIGIAGPHSVLERSGLSWVLPSRLALEDFGYRLP